jgi:HK97 family phage prohead protease
MDRIYCPFEFKIDPKDEEGTIKGYGSVFGNVDSHGDVVAKGAFKSSLDTSKAQGDLPMMLLQHGGDSTLDQIPIGVWTSMDEDGTGLKVEGKLALKTQRGSDVYELMKMTPRPALNGLSIGYRTKDFTMGSKTDKMRRTLNAVDLVEVSIVTSPSNKKATVTSVKSELNTIREFETFLRDVGMFSHAQAKAIAADGYKAIANLRDEVSEAEELAAEMKRLADFIRKIS